MSSQKHYLLSGSTTIELPLDKHFFFGRAEGNNIVVNDKRASRRHAEIYSDGERFVLLDLNSNNGTLVNGERITNILLTNGDRIEIGSQCYLYRVANSAEELEASLRELRQEAGQMVTIAESIAKGTIPESDFSGVLAMTNIIEICQMLELGGRDGMLTVRHGPNKKGLLYFRGGQIVGAECGFVEGEEAAMEALQFMSGTFSFQAGLFTPKTPISKKTSFLILEAMRRRDEGAGP